MRNGMDDEVIRFGINMMRTMLVGFMVAIVLGLLMDELWEGIIFCAMLMPLRENSGGFHMKTKWGCAVVSCLIYISVLVMEKMIYPTNIELFILYVFVAILFIVLVPVDNANNRLSKEQKRYLEKKSIRIFILESSLFMIINGIGNVHISFVMFMSFCVCDILLFIGVLANEVQNRNSR